MGQATWGSASQGGQSGGGRNRRRGFYCQICRTPGHAAMNCCERFNQHFVPPPPPSQQQTANQGSGNFVPMPQAHHASSSMPSVYPPMNLYHQLPPPPSSHALSSGYPDTGATHHVTAHTGAPLSVVMPYSGAQQLQVGDGSSLPITHIGAPA